MVQGKWNSVIFYGSLQRIPGNYPAHGCLQRKVVLIFDPRSFTEQSWDCEMGKISNWRWWAFIINSFVNDFYNFIIFNFLWAVLFAVSRRCSWGFSSCLLFWQLDDTSNLLNWIWNEKKKKNWVYVTFWLLLDFFHGKVSSDDRDKMFWEQKEQ